MNNVKIYNKILLACITAAAALLYVVPVVAQTVTQGYGSDSLLQRGMIVGLKKDDLRKVEPVNSDQFDRVHGVVVGANESAVLLNRENEKIYVATGGRNMVIVSDQNGDIIAGDFVTVSGVSGIGMRAGTADPIVLGKAIDSFKGSDSNQIVGTAKIKDSKGVEKQIRIGHVTVDVSIGKNPRLKADDSLPEVLRRASEYIAGKTVSATRVYISLALLIISSIVAGSLIYSAIRSSLIAVGRNPLSKKSIMRSLFQVIIVGFMVFLSGIFGVYLLLKL